MSKESTYGRAGEDKGKAYLGVQTREPVNISVHQVITKLQPVLLPVRVVRIRAGFRSYLIGGKSGAAL